MKALLRGVKLLMVLYLIALAGALYLGGQGL